MILPPPPDLRAVGVRPEEIHAVPAGQVWARVHMTTTAHAAPWNAMRVNGPRARFDPHPAGPPTDHPGVGVWYGSRSILACLAEVFQATRVIDRHAGGPHLTTVEFTRPLNLLDLTGQGAGAWPVRAGTSYALSTAPHADSQQWARAIAAAFPHLDGLLYLSKYSNQPSAALFTPALSAMPATPRSSRPLSDLALTPRLARAARTLGYTLI